MVLLERKWFCPDQSLPEAAPEEEVWLLEATGEVFTDYTEYLNQLYLTRTRVWSSVYSGVGNLTYEEALREDERGHALAKKVGGAGRAWAAADGHQLVCKRLGCPAQFPPDLEAKALRLVHHSTLRLDDLIDYIHDALKPRAIAAQGREGDAQTDKLRHPAPRSVIRCWLFEVSPASCVMVQGRARPVLSQTTRCWKVSCVICLWAGAGGRTRAHWGLPELLEGQAGASQPAWPRQGGACGGAGALGSSKGQAEAQKRRR